jgi:hypothetical protein
VSRKAKGVLVGATFALLILVCCGGGLSALSSMGTSAPDNPIPAPVTTGASTPASVEATAKASGIKNGQWLVGTDVPAGRYQSAGPDGDYMCYWQLTTTPNAQPGDPAFLTNDSPSGHAYVTLKKGEYFTTSHCGTWTPVQ